MPVVEGGELVDQVDESRDLILGVVSDDLAGRRLRVRLGIPGDLAVNEAGEVGLESAIGNGFLVRVEGAVELEVVTGDRVVRVVQDGVKVLVEAGVLSTVRFGHIGRVGEGPLVDDVVETGTVDTTEDVVVGTVLQKDPDDILNIVLQVGNRLGGAGFVAKGRLEAGQGSSKAGAGQTEKSHQSVGLHGEDSWTGI